MITIGHIHPNSLSKTPFNERRVQAERRKLDRITADRREAEAKLKISMIGFIFSLFALIAIIGK